MFNFDKFDYILTCVYIVITAIELCMVGLYVTILKWIMLHNSS